MALAGAAPFQTAGSGRALCPPQRYGAQICVNTRTKFAPTTFSVTAAE